MVLRTSLQAVGRLVSVLPEIAAAAAAHDLDASFPFEAFETLHQAGILALTVPAAVGGGGAGLASSANVVERLGAADPSVGLVVMWQLVFHGLISHQPDNWPVGLRDVLQRSAVEDGALINALSAEPDLGSPIRGGVPATTARRQGGPEDGWRVTGHKLYSTGIPALRWLAVVAATDEATPRVGQFVVDARDGGFVVDETWDHLGLRATASHEVILDGVRPRGLRQRPRRGRHPTGEQPHLRVERAAHGRALPGDRDPACDWLVAYLNERTPTALGAPLATLPRFQQAVGHIESLLYVNHRLIHDTAAEYDRGDLDEGGEAQAPVIKHVVTKNAVDIVDSAMQLVGNAGLTRSNPLERHHRDVLTGPIHTPQADFTLTNSGRRVLERARLPVPHREEAPT